MIRQTCFLGAALALGLASCASVQPPSLEPLTVLRSEALQRVIEPLPQNFSSQVNAASFQNVSTPGLKFGLALQLFAVDEACVQQAFASAPTLLAAVIVPRAQADQLSVALSKRTMHDVELLADSRIEVFAGNAADMLVTNQRAYVGGFEITATVDGAIADPRVDIAQEGILFHVAVAGDSSGAATHFDFTLTQVQLDAKLQERRVEMLSGAAPLTLQLPSGITDKIRASCTLARDEALIFAGNQASLDGQSRALLGVLTAENAGP